MVQLYSRSTEDVLLLWKTQFSSAGCEGFKASVAELKI